MEVPGNRRRAERMRKLAARGIDPVKADITLLDYGANNMDTAPVGLEDKSKDPYLCGWRQRVVPTLGHLQYRRSPTASSTAQWSSGSPKTAAANRPSRTPSPSWSASWSRRAVTAWSISTPPASAAGRRCINRSKTS
ncbi:hypothetical protein [Nocardia sp. BMG51109]|uniref:hypothetical protein n=1 Tax=Nocardia sp. BMG51109 TaxID=1056816 RepID=UPI0012EC5EBB|nr:hypothetical protein [Nocardia sp. BMG51109]